MKKVAALKDEPHLNAFLDWIIYLVGYTLILMLLSKIFPKSLIISNIAWAFVASLIIYLLNKTVKPIIFYLTLPITGITLGLFYPFVNVIVLYLTSWILGETHFNVEHWWMVFIIAILISILNILVDSIVKKVLRRDK